MVQLQTADALARPRKADDLTKNVKDRVGHEHGRDSLFVGTDDSGYEHGKEADFPYFRIRGRPKTSGYGEDIEPHGRYMSEMVDGASDSEHGKSLEE